MFLPELRECQGRHNSIDLAYLATVTGLLDGQPPKRPSFRYLLALTTRFSTSEPRDRIFATLDLLRSSAPDSSKHYNLIAPDYSKPVAQVFRDATIFSLLDLKYLNIFRNIYHRSDATLEVGEHSSWVPQWYRTFDFRQDVHRLPEIFNASLCTKTSSPSLNSASLLKIRVLHSHGFRVAQLTQQTGSMTMENLAQVGSLNSVLKSIDDITANFNASDTVNIENVLARTLVVGRNPEGDEQFRTSLKQGKSLPSPFSGDRIEGLQAITGLSKRYYNLLYHYCSNRRFFGATNGYIGVAASPVRLGDLVVILYGAPWPVILRPTEDRGFQFVSQCYIDGIMHGEAVQEHGRKGFADEDFTLV